MQRGLFLYLCIFWVRVSGDEKVIDTSCQMEVQGYRFGSAVLLRPDVFLGL